MAALSTGAAENAGFGWPVVALREACGERCADARPPPHATSADARRSNGFVFKARNV